MGSDQNATVLRRCRRSLPAWRSVPDEAFDFTPPRGFSSFTMAVRCEEDVEPAAVLYRQLEDKDNAILDFDDEKRVYRTLESAGIAARCYAYEREFRLEEFYDGRTLTRDDLKEPAILGGIGRQLARFHRLSPELPAETFFERIHRRWGADARRVLTDRRDEFPENERAMCDELLEIVSPETREKVRRCVPDEPAVFCHNDTYQGNVMLLAGGEVRLLDFEFSCRNHRAFDFANLFAETVTRHGLAEYPYFDIVAPEYERADIKHVVEAYVDEADDASLEVERLVDQAESMIVLSDYMYAMAALPLAVEPVQKIRFIPYSLRRFRRFENAWSARFG